MLTYSPSHFLSFHILLESVSILVAFTLGVTVWNFRFDITDEFILFLGILFFTAGGIDTFYVLSYQGMPIFITEGSYQKAYLLWIYGRLLVGFGILGGALVMLPNRTKKFNFKAHYSISLILVAISIVFMTDLANKVPPLYLKHLGATPLKRLLDGLVILINFLSIVVLFKKRNHLKTEVLYRIVLFLMISNFSELTFIIYKGAYDNYCLLGHGLKILAYYQLYLGVYRDGILANHLLASTVSRLSRRILRPEVDLVQTGQYIVEAFSFHLKKPDRIVFYIRHDASTFSMLASVGEYSDMIKGGDIVDPQFKTLEFTKPQIFKKLEQMANPKLVEYLSNDTMKDISNKTKDLLFIPLNCSNTMEGFLIAYNFYENKSFNSDDIIAADSLASFASLALEHAKVVKRMHQFSFEDVLTKLNNRRYFMDKLSEITYDSKRYNKIFSLVVIDMDGMKFINDNFGHQAGDEALKKIAYFLKKAFRKTDVVARFGGDEFGIIVKHSEKEAATKKMLELQEEISNYELPDCGCKLAISFGVAAYPEDAQAEDELLKIADDRMYEQKIIRKGRR